MKCILCQFWKRLRWQTIKHTGQWIYQERNNGTERRIVKGPKQGSEIPDLKWRDRK